MMKKLLSLFLPALFASLGLVQPAPASAQKALVVCPPTDGAGCERVAEQLATTATPGGPRLVFPGGVDKSYEALRTLTDAQLRSYAVVFVPSFAGAPYSLLREEVVKTRLRSVLTGRVAVWSGTPDRGSTTGASAGKLTLIQNLARWTAGGYTPAGGGTGLVVLQDASDESPDGTSLRYNWVEGISGVKVAPDLLERTYSRVEQAQGNAAAAEIIGTLAYTNMASFGLATPDAPGVASVWGVLGTGARGQAVLVTFARGAASSMPMGRQGGTVNAAGGRVSITFPEGALSQQTTITVESATGVPADPDVVPGTAVELGPHGIQFAKPVTLTLKYDKASLPAGTDETSLAIYKVVEGTFVRVPGGSVDVTAGTVSGQLSSFSTYVIKGTKTAATPATVEVTPSSPTLGVNGTQQMTATIKDASGNELTGTVTWSSSNTGVALIDKSGLVSAKASGSAEISATTSNGVTGKATVTVTSVAKVEVSPNPLSLPVSATQQMSAVLKDATGNVIAGTVTWSSSNTGVAPIDKAGVVTGKAQGSAVITATSSNGVTGTADVTVAAADAGGAVYVAKESGDGGSQMVATPRVLQARVTDKNGKAVANYTVSWAVASGGGSLSAATSTTNSLGIAEVTWTIGTTAGSQSVTATAGTLSGSPLAYTLNATPGAVTASNSTLAASPTTLTADGTSTSTFTVQLKDQYGNNLVSGGHTVALTATSGRIGSVTDHANGTYTATLTAPTTIGSATVSGTVNGGALANTVAMTYTAGAVARLAIKNGNGQSATVGTAVATAPSVLVTDAHSNPVSGVNVTFTPSADGKITGSPAATDMAGVATLGSWTLGSKAGENTLTASVEGLTSVSFTATATQVPVASVVVSPAADTLSVGETQQLSATLKDANGNELTGRSVAWESSSPAVATVDASGRVTAVTAGSVTITATSEGISGASAILVPVPVASVSLTPENTSFYVRSTQQLNPTLKDASGNVLTGRMIEWRSSNEAVVTVDASGVVTGVAPGSATVTATSEGKSANGSFTVTLLGSASGNVGPQTVSSGRHHACSLTASGAAQCWGRGDAGQLGNGQTANSTRPVLVSGGRTFTMLASGYDHTCGLTPEGRAFCWGSNNVGQLGNGTLTSSSVPVEVSGGLTFQSLTAGFELVCGVTTEGKAYCWGGGFQGKLGNGDDGNRSTPQAVVGGHSFQLISGGGDHACGITRAGTLLCWGKNADGPLGTGNNTSSSSPVAVSGSSTFRAVTAGEFHTCAITRTGVAQCWGAGGAGRLGNRTSTSTNTPSAVAVPTGVTMQSMEGGNEHTCATATDGTAYCWGRGDAGQLGNGGTANSDTPVRVSSSSLFRVVSGGTFFSCAMTQEGAAQCWGANGFGKLGDGTTNNSSSPSVVLDPAPPVAPVASVTVTPGDTTVAVGGVQQFFALLRDASGNELTGRTVEWKSSDTNVATVDADGRVTAVAPGSVTITATSEGQGATVTVTVPVSATQYLVTSSSASPAAGGTVTITAQIADASGSAVSISGKTVTWSSTGGGSFASTTSTTDANGHATVVFTTSTTAGTAHTVTATDGEGLTGTSGTITTQAGAAAALSKNAGDNQSAVAGAAVPIAPSVKITDINGNPVLGATITFAPSGDGKVDGSPATTGANGVATLGSWTLASTSGSNTLTATAGTLSATFTATGLEPVATVDVTPNRLSLAPNETVRLVATLKDKNGNVLLGRSVTWSSSNPSIATVSSTGSVTGVATGTVTISAQSEGQTGASSITVELVVQRWATERVGVTSDWLTDVWGTSRSNVYAVGGRTIARYDGTKWTKEAVNTDQQIAGIWGTSASNVFSVGSGGTILRYDGSAWRTMTSGTTNTLSAVSGASDREVFAVGQAGTILRYNGTEWGAMASGTIKYLFGVWVASPSAAYAVGEAGTILRYDGTTWTVMSSGTSVALNAVWGTSETNIYAAGSGGIILRFDGTSWQRISSPTGQNIDAIWGTSPSDIFVAGNDATFYRYNGAAWTRLVPGKQGGYRGIWGSASNDVFTVGIAGEILHYDGAQVITQESGWELSSIAASGASVYAGGVPGALLRHDGASWGPMSTLSATGNQTTAVWARSESDVYVAGYGVFHFNGSGWRRIDSVPGWYYGLWGSADGSVWAVGQSGRIQRWDGSAWTAETSGTSATLRAVWGTSQTNIFAVGDGGVILRYNGTSWTPMQSGTTSYLYAVWGTSENDVYAVGGGVILHYDGTSWKRMETDTWYSLRAVYGTSPTTIYAVGDGGKVLRYNGSTWKAVSSGTTENLRGVWGSSSSDIRVVGTRNLILRGAP